MERNEKLAWIKSKYVNKEIINQARNSLQRLSKAIKKRSIQKLEVIVPFGGGKDSAWMLAFVRIMQILLLEKNYSTFHLHVFVMLHPGVTQGVYKNIQNVFSALELYEDTSVKLFATTLGGCEINLDSGLIDATVKRRYKEEVLYSGHLSLGNGRETFCYACNFALMNGITRYVIDKKIDLVITGDSKSEILFYWKWIQKTAKLLGIVPLHKDEANWYKLFGKMSEINIAYYKRLFNIGTIDDDSIFYFPNIIHEGSKLPEYFSIYNDVHYEYWKHDEFIEKFLGFRLYPDAFNFTESDCKNPMLMAHLRGLNAEFNGSNYKDGIEIYLRLVKYLMVKKSYSDKMIELAIQPYTDDVKILSKRFEAENFARLNFEIEPIQLKAMVAGIFTDSMIRLESFFKWALPCELNMLPPLKRYLAMLKSLPSTHSIWEKDNDKIMSVLRNQTSSNHTDRHRVDELTTFIEKISGLPIRLVRKLLDKRSNQSMSGCAKSELSEMDIIRMYDPHQLPFDNPARKGETIIVTGR
jgi:hypothetical protein